MFGRFKKPQRWKTRPDAVLLRRMKRVDERAWADATSCFGGRPRLGDRPWPIADDTGHPMMHIASVELSQLPRSPNLPPVPKTGRLAFFISDEMENEDVECAVLHIADATPGTETPVPDGALPIYGKNWKDEVEGYAREEDVPRTFNRWPMEFSLLEISEGDGDYNRNYGLARKEALDRIAGFEREAKYVHFFLDGEYGPVDPGIFPWKTARHLVDAYRWNIAVAGEKGGDGARRLVAKWDPVIEAQPSYAPMGSDAAAQLEQDMREARPRRSRFSGSAGELRIAAQKTYTDMMTGDTATFMMIPESIREFMVHKRCRSGWSHSAMHQMFGKPVGCQTEFSELDEVVLLSAQTDDMLDWMWWDVGELTFLIEPADLLAGRWEKASAMIQGC